MVKQTFLNLTEEKRRLILDTAMEEFATHKYSKASLSNIVSRAGIAKGSMYQYFADKKDLFVHLLEIAAREKLAYMNRVLDKEGDFFTAVKRSIAASIEFARDHPKMSRVIVNAMEPLGEAAIEEINIIGKQLTLEFFEKILLRGQQEGSVRPDADVSFAAYMLSAMMSWGLADYMLSCIGVTVKEYLNDPDPAGKITQEMLDHIIHEIMNFLHRGLGTKG